MTPEEIESSLTQFTGSETFTRWSPLFRKDVLTEGAKFVADKCACYWLMDAIASHQHNPKVKPHPFQVWKLIKSPKYKDSWDLICEDGNDNEVTRQHIGFSDFPLQGITLFTGENELGGITIMLPSEY